MVQISKCCDTQPTGEIYNGAEDTTFGKCSECGDYTFFDEVTEIRELAKELPYDFWVVLVGDTITEEKISVKLKQIFENGISEKWSKKCRDMVDGKGVERVCESMGISFEN